MPGSATANAAKSIPSGAGFGSAYSEDNGRPCRRPPTHGNGSGTHRSSVPARWSTADASSPARADPRSGIRSRPVQVFDDYLESAQRPRHPASWHVGRWPGAVYALTTSSGSGETWSATCNCLRRRRFGGPWTSCTDYMFGHVADAQIMAIRLRAPSAGRGCLGRGRSGFWWEAPTAPPSGRLPARGLRNGPGSPTRQALLNIVDVSSAPTSPLTGTASGWWAPTQTPRTWWPGRAGGQRAAGRRELVSAHWPSTCRRPHRGPPHWAGELRSGARATCSWLGSTGTDVKLAAPWRSHDGASGRAVAALLTPAADGPQTLLDRPGGGHPDSAHDSVCAAPRRRVDAVLHRSAEPATSARAWSDARGPLRRLPRRDSPCREPSAATGRHGRAGLSRCRPGAGCAPLGGGG